MSTGIEWTEETWNPVTGCSKVSEGCRHCYAERLSHRFGWTDKPWTAQNAAENVKTHPERLDKPLKVRQPKMWFVNSMSDLFHQEVSAAFVKDVFDVMVKADHHTFQILTKRPERMMNLVNNMTQRFFPVPNNVWLGTSVEDERSLVRIDRLREVKCAVRFLSCEPLLGPLHNMDLSGIHWVIVGAESGPGARPMNEDWVRDIRDQCVEHGVAFFYKQNAVNGKKISLPELDGKVWNEMPRVKQEG